MNDLFDRCFGQVANRHFEFSYFDPTGSTI